MDEEQLNITAQLLSNEAIKDAMDELLREEMEKDLDQGVDDIVELTIKQSIRSIRDGMASPTDKMMGELQKSLTTITTLEGLEAVTTGQPTKTSWKKRMQRLLDRLLRRNKKVEEVDHTKAGGSSGTPNKNLSKVNKLRNWLCKHVCCFTRQSD